MYLTALSIAHLRRVRGLDLSFLRADGSPRMWTVLIGDNGTAKTTILQAMALAAAGSLQANGLAQPIVRHLRDRRPGASKARMVVRAAFTTPSERPNPIQDSEWLMSSAVLSDGSSSVNGTADYVPVGSDVRTAPFPTRAPRPAGDSDLESSRNPLDVARADELPGWFVAAYGVARTLPVRGMTVASSNVHVQRLEPIFRATPLRATAFGEYFKNGQREVYYRCLREVLVSHADLLPHVEDVRFESETQDSFDDAQEHAFFLQSIGVNTARLPATSLSHGYQSTVAWIADLVGHMVVDQGKDADPSKFRGLVLLDEIDLFLHPRWQAGLVTALRKTFPHVQFVATTHSPVILAGAAPDEIVRLGFDDQGDVVRMMHDERGKLVPSDMASGGREPDPRTMTGGEVFRSYFGLDRLTLNPLGEDLRREQILASDPTRTDDEHQELLDLRRTLRGQGVALTEPRKRR